MADNNIQNIGIVLICLIGLVMCGDVSFSQDATQAVDTTHVLWHPDGRYLAVFQEDIIRFVDSNTLKVLSVMTDFDIALAEPEWSPDGTQIAIANGRNVEIWATPWDTQAAERIRVLTVDERPNALVGHIDWTADKIAIATAARVTILDTSDFSTLVTLPSSAFMWDVEFAPDRDLLAISRNLDALEIWNMKTGQVEWGFYFQVYFDQYSNRIDPSPLGIDWSPDGSQIAFGATDGLRVVDLSLLVSEYQEIGLSENPAVTELKRVYTQDDGVLAVDWHPTKNLIVSGGQQGLVRIYDVTSSEMVYEIQVHNNYGGDVRVRSVAWSPDGTRLAYGLPPASAAVPVAIITSP